MAPVVGHDYYRHVYGGTLVEVGDWLRLYQLASAHLRRLKALAKVTPYGKESECEAMAICAMAEVLQAWEDAGGTGGGGVASESIGSVSVTYQGASQSFPRGLDENLVKAISPWLHVCVVVG